MKPRTPSTTESELVSAIPTPNTKTINSTISSSASRQNSTRAMRSRSLSPCRRPVRRINSFSGRTLQSELMVVERPETLELRKEALRTAMIRINSFKLPSPEGRLHEREDLSLIRLLDDTRSNRGRSASPKGKVPKPMRALLPVQSLASSSGKSNRGEVSPAPTKTRPKSTTGADKPVKVRRKIIINKDPTPLPPPPKKSDSPQETFSQKMLSKAMSTGSFRTLAGAGTGSADAKPKLSRGDSIKLEKKPAAAGETKPKLSREDSIKAEKKNVGAGSGIASANAKPKLSRGDSIKAEKKTVAAGSGTASATAKPSSGNSKKVEKKTVATGSGTVSMDAKPKLSRVNSLKAEKKAAAAGSGTADAKPKLARGNSMKADKKSAAIVETKAKKQSTQATPASAPPPLRSEALGGMKKNGLLDSMRKKLQKSTSKKGKNMSSPEPMIDIM